MNTSIFNDLDFSAMLWRIVGAVRRAARTTPAFLDSGNGVIHGVIRITVVPLSPVADEWSGDFNGYCWKFNGGEPVYDICEREFVYKIHPAGSRTIQWTDPKDGHVEPVNCYGYSALKTAHAAYRRQVVEEKRQYYDSEYLTEANGWSEQEGSVWTTVRYNDEDLMRIYVCTSGAESHEDQQCSLAGLVELQKFFESCTTFVFDPYIVADLHPLKQIYRPANPDI